MNRHLKEDNHYISLFVSKHLLRKQPQQLSKSNVLAFNLSLPDENKGLLGSPDVKTQIPQSTNISQLAHLDTITNTIMAMSPSIDQQQLVSNTTDSEDKLEDGAQPPHAPGEWGMYHWIDTRKTAFSCTLPGLQVPGDPPNAPWPQLQDSGSQIGGSVLSYMQPPGPSFILPSYPTYLPQ